MPTFTIMGSGIGYVGGNYKNDQPGQAAKKAGKALFKKLTLRKFAKYKNKTSIKFVLRMRDRHSAGKTYAYMVTREKLPKPIIMKKGNVEYEIKYNYKIEACNLTSNEVKTMTGGALAMVGGKLTYTGKAMKGGSTDGEGGEDRAGDGAEGEEEEGGEGGDGNDDEDGDVDDGNDGNDGNDGDGEEGGDGYDGVGGKTTGGKVGSKAKSSKASAKAKAAKTAKVSNDSKELNKAKAKAKK